MKINLEIIIIVVISVFVGYYMCKGNIQENFAVTDDVKQAINQLYQADVESVRNLSNIAKKLQEGGVTIPGKLTVDKSASIYREDNGKYSALSFVNSGDSKGAHLFFNDNDRQADGGPSTFTIRNDAGKLRLGGTEVMIDANANVIGKVKENGNDLLPKGSIIAWAGDTAPAGWALCDGSNGTPDLRGRFILGAMLGSNTSTTYTSTAVQKPASNYWGYGGEQNVTLNNMQIPDHTHLLSTGDGSNSADNVVTHWRSFAGADGADRTIKRRDNDTNSIVNVTKGGNKVTGGLPHNNMPPYWVLAYIMKL